MKILFRSLPLWNAALTMTACAFCENSLQGTGRMAREECDCFAQTQAASQTSVQTTPQTSVTPSQTPASPFPQAPAPAGGQKPRADRIHDPALAKEGDTYYLFSTGRGIAVHSSKDRLQWQPQPSVFAQAPTWTGQTIPGSHDNFWAPDISFFHGRWHCYYSVSTFGKNHSAIGLATNVTLDSARPNYQWKDEGLVIESQQSDDWNAIDPNLVLDARGQAWLTLGSFWSGIKLIALDAATGKPKQNARLYALASRPHTPDIQGAIEAPFLIRHGRFFYLFASFDFCCRGVNSTYNIRVGRAAQVTGPYVDRAGKVMLEGGGTLVLAGSKRWRGPGHNAVLHEGKRDWLAYHAYDAEDNGTPHLRMQELTWDAEDWPRVAPEQ